MFILWDRLFGTFVRGEREKRPPKYGLGRPQLTWNALWHQMEALMEAVRLVPEVGVVGALLTRSKGRAGRGSGEESLRGKGAYLEDGYAWVQFAAAVWLFFRFLPMAVSLGPRGAAEAAVMIAWAFVGATSLLDIHPASSEGQRRRILSWEAVRLGACFVAVRTGSGERLVGFFCA